MAQAHFERNAPTIFKGDITRHTAAQEYPLGTPRQYYENTYVYCKAGAVALSPALICVTPSIEAMEVEDTATVAHAIGTRDVTVTADADWTEDQFRDGYLWADSGTAIGECHRIATHPAIASSATGTITLAEPLVEAWSTTDTDISMCVSPYRGVLVAPTTAVGEQHAVCVPQWAVDANYYFWGLAKGFGAIKIDVAGATVGEDLDDKMLTVSGNHAGQGLIATPAEATVPPLGQQIIGYTVGAFDHTDNYCYLCKINLL